MATTDVAVVGAGSSGIAAALALKDRGITSLVIDRADSVGSAWRTRYDRLRLNTGRQFSHLPGRKFPKGTGVHPSRDEVIAHLERHAAEDGIERRLGTTVTRIDQAGGGWSLSTSDGAIDARQVIVATGHEDAPHVPDWPGRAGFGGEVIHSSQYRNPAPYEGKRVLVVGPGCSGMEIAYDLATGGAAKVWLAIRTPPNIINRFGPAGLPGDVIAVPLWHAPPKVADAIARFGRKKDFGDLTEYGLPMPDEGLMTRSKRLDIAPSIVDAQVIDAIKAGEVEIVRAMTSFEGGEAVLADGAHVEPDVVICATGYRRGLEPLVGHLGVLDELGRPTVLGPQAAAPGLRFIGYLPRPAAIGYASKVARRSAKEISRELR